MKICVYAICKNEQKFVQRWMESMSEADGVYVLDTGSQDDSAAQLQALGAEVVCETVTPWRFDTARNRSLELVPEDADICVCTDLDEVFRPGWRKALEAAWKPGTRRAQYRYVWSFNANGSEGTAFYISKVHGRFGFSWQHPVHEVLVSTDGAPEMTVTVPGMQLDHFPDPTKSRSSYLPLLEYSVREDPEDDRNMHYLGREYFYYGRWADCIKTLQRHLQLPRATWRDERAASMRYIARAYVQLGREQEAESWFLRAVAEAPHLREPYLDFARWLYEKENWDGVVFFTKSALQITTRPATYICEADAWGSLPWDLCALGLYYTGRAAEALYCAEAACAIEPDNERLQMNKKCILQASGV